MQHEGAKKEIEKYIKPIYCMKHNIVFVGK